jgi:hypothetical protein
MCRARCTSLRRPNNPRAREKQRQRQFDAPNRSRQQEQATGSGKLCETETRTRASNCRGDRDKLRGGESETHQTSTVFVRAYNAAEAVEAAHFFHSRPEHTLWRKTTFRGTLHSRSNPRCREAQAPPFTDLLLSLSPTRIGRNERIHDHTREAAYPLHLHLHHAAVHVDTQPKASGSRRIALGADTSTSTSTIAEHARTAADTHPDPDPDADVE